LSLDDTICQAVAKVLETTLPRLLGDALEKLRAQQAHPLAVDTAEAGRLLSTPASTIRDWIREGKMRATRTPSGRDYLIAWAEIERVAGVGSSAASNDGPDEDALAAAIVARANRKRTP
jgi:excisionase family DNA binding protein